MPLPGRALRRKGLSYDRGAGEGKTQAVNIGSRVHGFFAARPDAHHAEEPVRAGHEKLLSGGHDRSGRIRFPTGFRDGLLDDDGYGLGLSYAEEGVGRGIGREAADKGIHALHGL